MEKYGFVYIWYDRKHTRYYVGCHWGKENDGYICSSAWMMQAYKIRPQDFKRKILKTNISNRVEMFNEEQRYFNMIKPEELKIRYYNLNIKNNEIWSKYDEKIKTISEKISATAKKNAQDPIYRAKYLEGLKIRDTKASNPDVCEKKRKSMIGKNAGKITAKDESGNIFHTTKDDPRWISGEIWAASKGVKRSALSEEHKTKIKEAGVFKLINSKRISCIHCGTQGNAGQIGRYHNDRCKKIRIV